MHRTPTWLAAVLLLVSTVALAPPAHAQTDCGTPRCGPYQEDPGDGCLGTDDPLCGGGGGGCEPESLFDDSCDGGGADVCSGGCRDCVQTSSGWTCTSVYWSAHCSCWIEQEEDGNLTCNTRGSCSVAV